MSSPDAFTPDPKYGSCRCRNMRCCIGWLLAGTVFFIVGGVVTAVGFGTRPFDIFDKSNLGKRIAGVILMLWGTLPIIYALASLLLYRRHKAGKLDKNKNKPDAQLRPLELKVNLSDDKRYPPPGGALCPPYPAGGSRSNIYNMQEPPPQSPGGDSVFKASLPGSGGERDDSFVSVPLTLANKMDSSCSTRSVDQFDAGGPVFMATGGAARGGTPRGGTRGGTAEPGGLLTTAGGVQKSAVTTMKNTSYDEEMDGQTRHVTRTTKTMTTTSMARIGAVETRVPVHPATTTAPFPTHISVSSSTYSSDRHRDSSDLPPRGPGKNKNVEARAFLVDDSSGGEERGGGYREGGGGATREGRGKKHPAREDSERKRYEEALASYRYDEGESSEFSPEEELAPPKAVVIQLHNYR